MQVYSDIVGVFGPKGELEAVELTKDSAAFAAVHLSPNQKQPNRRIGPVVVFTGDIGTVIVDLLANAVDVDIQKRLAEFNRVRAECTQVDDKGRSITIPTAEYQQAKELLTTSLKFKSAFYEDTPNV